MFEGFKRFVKNNQVNEEAAAVPEQQQIQTPAQVRPGSEVNRPVVARPAARPAMRPAKQDKGYDDFLEQEVGSKLKAAKDDAARLKEARDLRAAQIDILESDLTEEEAKSPEIKALLERLRFDKGNIEDKLEKNPAPKDDPKDAKDSKDDSKDASKDSKGSKDSKDDPKDAKDSKDDSKDASKDSKDDEGSAPQAFGSGTVCAWTIDEIVLCFPSGSGYAILGYKDAYIAARQLGRKASDVKWYAVTPIVDVTGKTILLPIGEAICTLDQYMGRLRKSQNPTIPDFQEIVEEYAAAKMVTIQTRNGETVCSGVPAIIKEDPVTRKRKCWALSPKTWALGAYNISLLGYEATKLEVTLEDGSITKVTRDESQNLAGDFC